MKFLSITGPKDDIDRVVDTYLSKYEIHLENALAQLSQVQNLSPYIEANPYRDSLAKVSEYAELLGDTGETARVPISVDESLALISDLNQSLTELTKRENALYEERKKIEKARKDIEPFLALPCDMKAILHFEFVRCRFGRVPKQYYANFENYVYDHLEAVFYPCSRDNEYVWGVYFVPRPQEHKVNVVFSSMHFERTYLEDIYEGTPAESYEDYGRKLSEVEAKIRDCDEEMGRILQEDAVKILSAKDRLEKLSVNFDVRKVAGCIKEKQDNFYILCGWMTEQDAASLQKEVESDENLYCIIEDDQNEIQCKPPTKLRNPKIIQPFEMYVKMFGLPGYRELDPTLFMAITYPFIFGAMFGDVGQGFCLMVGGFLLYHFKKMDLAAIIGTAGIFSILFGFLYGSFFGFEDVLPSLWLKPVDAMMDVPVLGKINTVFVVAIAFGMILNLVSMILHMASGIRQHSLAETLLDANGLAGFIFYGAIFVTIMLFLNGMSLPGTIVMVIMFGVPLMVVFLKELIANLIEKRPPIEGSKPMYFVEAFFELFEICLSYFSNTLSFVRIGAFAVSHAAMMEVVLMLAGAEAGSPNWIVVVLGNIFVCAMEGLIVGIQVLRLEYYELFSRFYKGDGKEFVPFIKQEKKAQ